MFKFYIFLLIFASLSDTTPTLQTNEERGDFPQKLPFSDEVKDISRDPDKTDTIPTKSPNIPTDSTLIQRCPEAWYDNQMPRVVREGEVLGTTQYLIMDGKRVELNQVDMQWVSKNCQIQKQTVY